MSSATNDKLQSARLKVEWAKKHIVDLNRAIRTFFDCNPYQIRADRDPQVGGVDYYVERVDPIPALIPCLAGDAIQNLRSALDHLAYQIFLAGPNPSPRHANNVFFPIVGGAKEYETGKLGIIHSATKDAIDAIEPYKGGKGHQLWVLNKLNNINRHRLIIAIGSISSTFVYSEDAVRELRPHFEAQGIHGEELLRLMDSVRRHLLELLNPFALLPLKAGQKLIGFGRDAEPDQIRFTFHIAISEPGIIESKSLIEALHQLANLVDGIVTAFAPLV